MAALLGLETALSAPWTERPERVVTVAELLESFGAGAAASFSQAVEVGLLVPGPGDGFRMPNAAALDRGSYSLRRPSRSTRCSAPSAGCGRTRRELRAVSSGSWKSTSSQASRSRRTKWTRRSSVPWSRGCDRS